MLIEGFYRYEKGETSLEGAHDDFRQRSPACLTVLLLAITLQLKMCAFPYLDLILLSWKCFINAPMAIMYTILMIMMLSFQQEEMNMTL